jgi:hypothetical protein
MSWTMHPEKPGYGEALGQVPGGSGLGVTVMQRIMGLVCEHNSFYRSLVRPRLRMKLMVIPVGRSLVFKIQDIPAQSGGANRYGPQSSNPLVYPTARP